MTLVLNSGVSRVWYRELRDNYWWRNCC